MRHPDSTPENANPLVVMSKFEPEYSGPGIRVINLYKDLKQRSYVKLPKVICGSKDYNSQKAYSIHGFEVFRITLGRLNRYCFTTNRYLNFFFRFLLFLKSICHLYQATKHHNVIHVLGSSGVVDAAIVLAHCHRKPLVVELVNRGASVPKIPRLLGCTFSSTLFVTISPELKEKALQFAPPNQVWHRPNPVDIDRFNVSTASTDQNPTKTILYVSSFLPRKNHEFLVDVIERLPDNYRLIFGGPVTHRSVSNSTLSKLRARIQDSPREQDIFLHVGFLNMAELLNDSDIYANPASNEGLGTTVLEALASAVPVVANSDEPAFSHYITDGRNGHLSKLDPEIFAKKVEKSSSIPRGALLDEARKIRREISSEYIHEKYLEILKPSA